MDHNIKFFDVTNESKNPVLLFEERPYTEHGFTCMDSEKDKLVTGSHNGEVIAWCFEVQKYVKIYKKVLDMGPCNKQIFCPYF